MEKQYFYITPRRYLAYLSTTQPLDGLKLENPYLNIRSMIVRTWGEGHCLIYHLSLVGRSTYVDPTYVHVYTYTYLQIHMHIYTCS